jgi:hypothetical protein
LYFRENIFPILYGEEIRNEGKELIKSFVIFIFDFFVLKNERGELKG